MRAFVLSGICAILLASLIFAGIVLRKPPDTSEENEQIQRHLAALAAGLRQTQEAVTSIHDRLEELEQRTHAPPAAAPGPIPEETPAGDGDSAGAPPQILEPYSAATRDYVFALIEEERTLQETLRRDRADALRRELEELRQGPYDRFNLKVNSLGKALELNTAQKDRYYELSKAYWDELQELRKTTKWQDNDARRRFKEEQDRVQKAFGTEVEGFLTGAQMETYRSLPSWSRNIHNLGRVPPPGVGSSDANGGYSPTVKREG